MHICLNTETVDSLFATRSLISSKVNILFSMKLWNSSTLISFWKNSSEEEKLFFFGISVFIVEFSMVKISNKLIYSYKATYLRILFEFSTSDNRSSFFDE